MLKAEFTVEFLLFFKPPTQLVNDVMAMAIFCLHCFTLSALSSVELRYLYSTDVKRCRCFSFFVACRCFISHIDREIHQTAVSITTKKKLLFQC